MNEHVLTVGETDHVVAYLLLCIDIVYYIRCVLQVERIPDVTLFVQGSTHLLEAVPFYVAHLASLDRSPPFTVSAVALAVTRPFVKKFTKGRKQPTNADRYIGQEATVTEKISNELSTGAVRIGGLVWTARTVDNSEAEEGERVTVEAIEGAKLLVKRRDDL